MPVRSIIKTAIIEPLNSVNKASNILIEENKFLLILEIEVNKMIFEIGLEMEADISLIDNAITTNIKGG